LHVVRIVQDQIEVPGLGSPRHTLELSHDLYSLVHSLERHGEVFHCDVHVLQLLTELFPLVVPERGEVEVDQLSAEPGELVVQADAVVPALGRVLLVLGACLPSVRVDYLHLWVPDGHSNSSISPLEDLVRDV